MKRISILKFISFFAIIFLIACNANKKNTSNIDTSFNNNGYDELWKQVTGFDKDGLPQSGLKVVEEIFQKAKEEKNTPQYTKALIYKSKYANTLNQDGLVESINLMRGELENANGIEEAVLSSLLAEYYQLSFNQNQWQIRNRTEVVDYTIEDMQTWSIADFENTIQLYYLRSLLEPGTKEVALKEFLPAMTEGKYADELRPRLYNLLSQRAIKYFSIQANGFSDNYKLTDKNLFAAHPAFSKIELAKKNTSKKYWTLKLYQDELQFLASINDVPALIDIDLARLNFINQHANIPQKTATYLNALEVLQEKYSDHESSSEVAHAIAKHYMDQGRLYAKEDPKDDRRNHFIKAVEICNNTISKYPESFGANQCSNMLIDVERKEFSGAVEGENIPDKPFLLMLNYKNTPKAYVEVYKYDKKSWDEGPEVFHRTEDIKKISKYEKIWGTEYDLLNAQDHRQHSTELKIDGLPLGNYFIVVREKKDLNAKEQSFIILTTTITNIAYFAPNLRNDTHVIVVDRTTGAPIENATVDYYRAQNNRRSTFEKIETQKTDKNGMASIQGGQGNYRIVITNKDDVFYSNQYVYVSNHKEYNRSSVRAHFFTDRAIYRPGQKVFFKGILINTDNDRMPSIVPNKEITVIFYDANHQKVDEIKTKCNEFGSVSGSFDLPKNGLTGRMSIATNFRGSKHYFRVEEYKRPKFKVEFDNVEKDISLNEMVEVTGNAMTFAGVGVDNSEVRYRVTRQHYFPYVPWYMRSRYPMYGGHQEIANGTTTTDENGKFKVEFEAAADKQLDGKYKPMYRYEVIADVIDISGETRTGKTNLSVGTIGIIADIQIPETINKDSLVNVEISTKNVNQVPIGAQVKIKVDRLDRPNKIFKKRKWWSNIDEPVLSKATYDKEFPEYAYLEEDKWQNWKSEKTVLEKAVNTEKETSFALGHKNWEVGDYVIYLNSKDKNGNDIETKKHFKVYDLNSKSANGNTVFEHIREKETFNDPGNHDLYLKSNKDKLFAFFQLIDKNKIVEQEWIDVNLLKKKTIPITEKHRGNIQYRVTVVKDDRIYIEMHNIAVPWVNKDLKIEYTSFRDKLIPGADEEWTIKISGYKKDKVAAEMVATLYDASLDEFAKQNWSLNLYPTFSNQGRRVNSSFEVHHANQIYLFGDVYHEHFSRRYPDFIKWRELGRSQVFMMDSDSGVEEVRVMAQSAGASGRRAKSAPMANQTEFSSVSKNENMSINDGFDNGGGGAPPAEEKEQLDFSPRKNLKETVFFFPDLKTDADGNVIIKFKMNEALTKWKFMGLAHTKDLSVGTTTNETVTQKDLMVFPNPPRFMRAGDDIRFAGKVSNMTDKAMSGTAMLELFDATSEQSINKQLGNTQFEIPFTIPAGQSAPLMWNLKIPTDFTNAVTYRMKASTTNGSVTITDGEESSLPVVTNRMLVTESLPLWVRPNQTKDFTMESLLQSSNSSTLEHHNLSLEFTSNPAWYAVQALPYLSEFPHNCSEQIFNRYYANAVASYIANSNPNIKQVFDKWKSDNPEALLSNLSKNEELKTALLEETPWVLDAQNEEEQKRNIAILFDADRMEKEEATAMKTLHERQLANSGGFPWMPGGRPSWYITQYIVEGLGHLDKLGAKGKYDYMSLVNPAIDFIDRELERDYKEMTKRKGFKKDDDNLRSMAIHYLYARSFFLRNEMSGSVQKIVDYYKGQAEKYWLKKGLYEQGMLALALHRMGDSELPNKIIASLKERAIQNEELGMFWKYNRGYYWNQLPIETHALMIEAFEEIDDKKELVDEMRVWLLKNKQTNHWKTTKGTAAAIYALLIRGNEWLAESKPVQVSLASKKIDIPKSELQAGTGYFKTNYEGSEVTAEMSKVTVENKNDVIAWGGLYWQYFEDLNNIKTFEETPLTLKKKLFKEVMTDNGPVIKPIENGVTLSPGDKVKVRIELRVDRDMEYMHMKDMRASGFEPINVLSQYKWQDGLGYYESTKDLATHFFMDYLPRGTYVFEYPLRVFHKGDFSNGVTSIQCMYAPEFSSHSEGERVKVQ